MAAPVIVHIRRGKSLRLGLALLPIVLFCLMFFALVVSGTTGSSWVAAVSLACGVLVGALATFHIGIALRQPVALRMDFHGISGFYVTPATWDEIAKIGTFGDHNNSRFLGFALHDPIAFRDRQTPWHRFKSWSTGRSYGYHIVIPELILRNAKVDDLRTQALMFHSAATAADPLHRHHQP